MNPEKKFDAFLTCVIGDPDLKDLLQDLVDSNVLSVVYPPVKIKLVDTDRTYMVKITDGINSYVMHPNDIDDNMRQDIKRTFARYAPEDLESEPDTESARVQFYHNLGFDKD